MSQEKDLLKKKHKKISLWAGVGTILVGAIVGGVVGGIYATHSDSESLHKKQNSGSSSDNASSSKNNSSSDNKDNSPSKSDGQAPSKQTPFNDITFTALNPTANAYIGQKANKTFSVTTSDNLTGYNVTYQWYENDNEISEATDSSYLASSTSSDTSGEIIGYSVKIHLLDGSNKSPLVITKKFTLTIYTLPTITFTQNNQTVTTIVNQQATTSFEVVASSNLQGSVPTYSWYKNSINSSNLVTDETANSYAATGADADGNTSYYCVISLKNETLQLTYELTKVFTLQTITPQVGFYSLDYFQNRTLLVPVSSIDLLNTYIPLSEIESNITGEISPFHDSYFIYIQNITNGIYLSNANFSNTDFTYYSLGWDSAQLTFNFIAPNGTKIFDFSVSMQDLLHVDFSSSGYFYLRTCSSSNVSATYNWITNTNNVSQPSYNLTQNGNYTLSATVKVNGITATYQSIIQITNAVSQTLPSGLTYSTNISSLQSFSHGYYQEIITYTDGKIDYDRLTNIEVTIDTNGSSLESYNKFIYYWYMIPTDPSASSTNSSYTAGLDLTNYQSLYNYEVNGYLIQRTDSSTLDLQQLLQSKTGIWHTIATELNGSISIFLYAYVCNNAGYEFLSTLTNGSRDGFLLTHNVDNNSTSSVSNSSSNNVIDTYSKSILT